MSVAPRRGGSQEATGMGLGQANRARSERAWRRVRMMDTDAVQGCWDWEHMPHMEPLTYTRQRAWIMRVRRAAARPGCVVTHGHEELACCCASCTAQAAPSPAWPIVQNAHYWWCDPHGTRLGMHARATQCTHARKHMRTRTHAHQKSTAAHLLSSATTGRHLRQAPPSLSHATSHCTVRDMHRPPPCLHMPAPTLPPAKLCA